MEFITYEQEGFVGILTINRPKALNALNSQVLDELNETIDSIDINETRALILTGAGDKSFVAGADIGEMSTLTKAEGEAFGKAGIFSCTLAAVRGNYDRKRCRYICGNRTGQNVKRIYEENQSKCNGNEHSDSRRFLESYRKAGRKKGKQCWKIKLHW